jgi:Holliday junction resolvasome RuvABC endonuclease subunit
LRFNRWLAKTITRAGELELIIYEQTFIPRTVHASTVEFLAGLVTRVQEQAAALEIPVATCHAMTLKKWTTGSGRATKDQMRAAVHDRHFTQGIPGDDNEVDAIALLYYAQETYATRTNAREGLDAETGPRGDAGGRRGDPGDGG